MIDIFYKLFHTNPCPKKVIVQTEVTGFAPEDGNKLVEIAVIEIDKNDVQTGNVFHAYINPERDVPEEIVAVHGLNYDFLKNYPTFPAYKEDFLHFIEGKEIKITNPSLRKWGAIILIVYGVTQLWHTIAHWIYYLIPDHMWEVASMFVDEVPQVLVALVIIIVGLKLIAGKKEELNGEGK